MEAALLMRARTPTSSHAPAPAVRNDYSGPTRQLTDQLISGRVNSAACNLMKSCMLIGFWPVSLNRSSVIRS